MDKKYYSMYFRVALLILVSVFVFRGIKSAVSAEKVEKPNYEVLGVGSVDKPVTDLKPPSRGAVASVKDMYSRGRVVPEVYKSMDETTQSFIKSKKTPWSNLLDLGDIYSRGVYPHLLPNQDMATLLNIACVRGPDPLVSAMARGRISNPVEVDDEDVAGADIDVSYGQSALEHALIVTETLREMEISEEKRVMDIEKRNSSMRQKANSVVGTRTVIKKSNTVPAVPVRAQNPPRRRPDNPERTARITARARIDTRRPTAPNQVGGGRQNTHDHGVTSARRTNLASMEKEFLKNGGSLRPHGAVIAECIELINSVRKDPKTDGLGHQDYVNAHDVLVSLSPTEYSNTGLTQINILDIVLKRVESIPDEQVRTNIRETLCKRLASGYSAGNPVCGTGKVSRILSVLEGVLEGNQKSVSIDLIEREIGDMASKVRDDYLSRVGENGRDNYARDMAPTYSEDMSKILKDKVKREYVDKMNMKETVLDPIVSVYTDAF